MAKTINPIFKYGMALGFALLTPIILAAIYIPTLSLLLFCSALLAYIFNPLVDKLETWKLPRSITAFTLTFVLPSLLLVAFFKVIPVVISSFIELGHSFPAVYDSQIQPFASETLGIDANWAELWAQLPELSSFIPNVNSFASKLGGLASLIIHSLLFAMMAFLLLRDWKQITAAGRQHLHDITPDSWNDSIDEVFSQIGGSISRLIRGQLQVSSLLAVYYGLSFHVIGSVASGEVQLFSIWMVLGIVTGYLNLIPYIGVPVGGLIAALLSIMTFQFEVLWIYFPLLLVITIGITIDHKVLTPVIIGRSLKINELFVYIAIYFGGAIGGITGIILALPVMVLVVEVFKHINELWLACREAERNQLTNGIEDGAFKSTVNKAS